MMNISVQKLYKSIIKILFQFRNFINNNKNTISVQKLYKSIIKILFLFRNYLNQY